MSMQRSVDSVIEWSNVILRHLGNPKILKLHVVRVNDVNGLIIDSGLAPNSTLRFETRAVEREIHSGFLAGPSLHPAGYGSTARLPDYFSENEFIVRLAEQLQEEVWETTHGDPVPSCPGHAHPAKAAALENTPYWVCPWNGEAIHPIIPQESL